MQIVETLDEFEKVTKRLQKEDSLIIPILADSKAHPAMNPLCALCISIRSESFLIGFNHNEIENLNPDLLLRLMTSQRVWALDKKTLEHILPGLTTHCINSAEYLLTGEVTPVSSFLTITHKKMYELHSRMRNINKSVPVMQHIAYLESIIAHSWGIIDKSVTLCDTQPYKFLNNDAISALAFIESCGIHVDADLVRAKYGDRINRYMSNNTLYSEYNLFTSTGRCSNKFGGINFAALSKKDGTRKLFTSRHENGVLVSMDFESFHLRLIADMIGYEFPTDMAVHEYLGRQYFDKEELTPEEYDEGKQISFKLLYGESRDVVVPEFFTEVYKYVDMLMVLLNQNGHILSPYFKREIRKDRIEDPTPSKVFNYMIQLAETELNLSAINKIRPLFDEKNSCPVLYTYDSVLFDYDMTDGKDLLKETIRILSHDGKFPMRVDYGTNYNDLKRLQL
jgi:hypothetical protein